MKSSRFFDKQGHFRVMFLCNPNRKTNEIALFFIFIQKPLIKLILYHNCRPALRYVAVLTAAIHSCFNSSTGHLSTKLRTAGLQFFWNWHCLKSVQIRSYFWCVFSRIRIEYGEIFRTLYFSPFSPSEGKYGLEITPYLDAFHALWAVSRRWFS